MSRIKKRKILIITFLVSTLFWQLGLFNRYNYLTAKIDIIREKPQLIEYGDVLSHFGTANNRLNQKYGFKQGTSGQFISTVQMRGIKSYNKVIEEFLIKRNGANWKKEYKAKLDSIIQIKMNE